MKRNQFGQEHLKAKEEHEMHLSNNMQRFLFTIAGALILAAITAFSGVILSNNQLATKTNTVIGLLKQDFDNFQNIRYQADMEQLNNRMAQYEARIDRLTTSTPP